MSVTTSEAIRLFENAHHKDSELEVSESTEAGTIRLIRTACKAFERRGDEKSGCAVHFHTYLHRLGIKKFTWLTSEGIDSTLYS